MWPSIWNWIVANRSSILFAGAAGGVLALTVQQQLKLNAARIEFQQTLGTEVKRFNDSISALTTAVVNPQTPASLQNGIELIVEDKIEARLTPLQESIARLDAEQNTTNDVLETLNESLAALTTAIKSINPDLQAEHIKRIEETLPVD